MIPKPQHAVAARFEIACPRVVCVALRVMLPAVDFDNELGPAAGEIDNEGPINA
jgi:hypothetical protein